MIVDTIERLNVYEALNPLIPEVVKFLKENDLSKLSTGKHEILGSDLFVNVQETAPKTREESRMETHRRMIDIQIPISAVEGQGYLAFGKPAPAEMDEQKDIAFHNSVPETYLEVQPGEFVIYFPGEGHCPGITPTGLKKAIFKLKA